MKIIVSEINPRITAFIKKHKIDALGFIPPTIRREVQLMKYIQSHLSITLPIIKLEKISGIIPVPQKSLSKLEERIVNADSTFAVTERSTYTHILLIDDAVGSGATLNQVAKKKIRLQKVAKKITGLAIVGSFKEFDVIMDIKTPAFIQNRGFPMKKNLL